MIVKKCMRTVLLVLQSLSLVWFCDPVDCCMPGFPVLHYLLEFAPTHLHWVGDAIQTSHPLSAPSPPALNPSQHQGLFQWVSSLHQLAKVLRLQFQPQSFQDIFRILLGLTGMILQSKGLSRVFSNTTVPKHQFFGLLYSPTLTSWTWILEKPGPLSAK